MKLSRESFLKKSLTMGSLISLTSLQKELYAFGSEENKKHRANPIAYAESLGYTEPIDQILLTALLAPNSHNSQPWKFQKISESEFYLFGDGDKQLPEIDPKNRQFYHTQGCFLELCHLTADSLMFDTTIKLFPKGKPSGKTFSKFPIAKVSLQPKTKCVHDFLFSGVSERRMNRSVYSGELLTNEELNDIHSFARPFQNQIRWTNDPILLKSILPILTDAFAMETNRYESNELNRKWFRLSKEEMYENRDGLTLEANGLSGLKLWFAKTFFVNLTKEVWHSEDSKRAAIEMFSSQANSAKALVFFISEGKDDETTWIQTGRDFMRYTLSCAVKNIAFHTMNQAVEDYPESRVFTKQLNGILKLKPNEEIQLIARVGRSDYQFDSLRRDLNSFFI
ncbi:Conserved hypothetical protein [Leptospira biflexa serovar Patoc strain 'Patoc 1 (Ames)']|uniref:Nitroreductase domain-containing protein n=1 Tax=Leptospira biflexa serovar Patoc (strain Patoc 1 / ATCC 23582 / Paris) TaxID=456481 RepID=B0SJ09_LEPBP|nr:hypothetical protein [Leptospira biflexa]ABZ92818.1 Conserved hypothetical protein [Leptospira biflexa serovar Patoc strain 'Patoc 1 (Ames)']ABZ96426.1 Hypothetical protein; putative signal peptide [Leptospira biflexa serovar Patoc strain 'Patoc 1 (Paris)']